MNIIKREGKWRLFERHGILLLMEEKTLDRIIGDPAASLQDEDERGFSGERKTFYEPGTSLVSICEDAAKKNAKRLEVSYDFFFGGSVRENYPSSPKTIEAYKVVYDVARRYGLDFSASVVSPLDIGGGYVRERDGEYGVQMQFKECAIGADGAFSVDMALQTQWTNNKGPIKLELEKVMAFAFNETRIEGTPYYYVDENAIDDVSAGAGYAIDEGSITVTGAGYGSGRITVSGNAGPTNKSRLLAVLVYKTPELDYFAPGAAQYIKDVIKTHADNGIKYGGFYSDEMHIQFDWDLSNHFGHDTEINTRYVTPCLAKEYARRYGNRFADFPKYLVYFAYHGHDFIGGEEGAAASQHVFGPDERGVYATWEFRKRYFEMLQNHVVDICNEAKDYAERLFGNVILTRAHSTWQESPTCDHFFPSDNFAEDRETQQCRYDYTRHYQWSSTVRENISACGDYFKWNRYLTGGGTDHPEGGYLDRNYFGAAFVGSLALLNKFPFSYYGFWGGPKPVMDALAYAGATYGNECSGERLLGHNIVQGLTPRVSDVLTLYPLDLNYVEERFGTWMVQYGYTDYITEDELLAHYKGVNVCADGGGAVGSAADGGASGYASGGGADDKVCETDCGANACDTDGGARLFVGERGYRAVCVFFSPFMTEECVDILRGFCEKGGKVIWFSAPPLQSGGAVLSKWRDMFGVSALGFNYFGEPRMDANVAFCGELSGIGDMKIITDLMPDFVYPVECENAIASVGGTVIGGVKRYADGCGAAAYIGCRVRDDQSQSIEPGIDTLYQVLARLGAYAEGSLEARSRREGERYLMNRFPNGAVSVANHIRLVREKWYGSFFRDEEKDAEIMKNVWLPPAGVELSHNILGREIEYAGDKLLTYRYAGGELLGFGGHQTRGIRIDEIDFTFSDTPVDIIWTRLDPRELEAGVTEAYAFRCADAAQITLPRDLTGFNTVVCPHDLHSGEGGFAFAASGGKTRVGVDDAMAGKWLVFYK